MRRKWLCLWRWCQSWWFTLTEGSTRSVGMVMPTEGWAGACGLPHRPGLPPSLGSPGSELSLDPAPSSCPCTEVPLSLSALPPAGSWACARQSGGISVVRMRGRQAVRLQQREPAPRSEKAGSLAGGCPAAEPGGGGTGGKEASLEGGVKLSGSPRSVALELLGLRTSLFS